MKSGTDVEMDAMADAILAEDARAEGLSMPEYRRRYGLIQRKELEEVSMDPDVLVSIADRRKA